MVQMIGICGYATHGKDSVANVLVLEFEYVKVAFADKLKECLYAINPYVLVEVDRVTHHECQVLKTFSEHVGEWDSDVHWLFVRLRALVDAFGWDRAKIASPDVRGLLQRIGTEAGRDIISPSLWIDLHRREAQKHWKVVVPDVRFPPNESDYVSKENNGIMIRVIDPRKTDNGVGTKHPSEMYADQIPVNITIINDGTLEDLRQKVLSQVGPLLYVE